MTYTIAHRGLATEAHRENSLPAVRAALAHVDVVEIDVRCTSDGVPVCIHDAGLWRTHGASTKVGHVTFTELRERAPDIATLAEMLAVVADAGGAVMLDVKVSRPRAVDAIIAAVEASSLRWCSGAELREGDVLAPGTVSFQSASAELLQAVRSRTGAGCLELIPDESSKRELVLTAPFIAAYAQGVTIPERLATSTTLRMLAALKLGAYVYTVNDQRRFEQLAAHGASAVFTDAVDRVG